MTVPSFYIRWPGQFLRPPKYPDDSYRKPTAAFIEQVCLELHRGRLAVIVDDEVFQDAMRTSMGSVKIGHDPDHGLVLSSYDIPGTVLICCERYMSLVQERLDPQCVAELEEAMVGLLRR